MADGLIILGDLDRPNCGVQKRLPDLVQAPVARGRRPLVPFVRAFGRTQGPDFDAVAVGREPGPARGNVEDELVGLENALRGFQGDTAVGPKQSGGQVELQVAARALSALEAENRFLAVEEVVVEAEGQVFALDPEPDISRGEGRRASQPSQDSQADHGRAQVQWTILRR